MARDPESRVPTAWVPDVATSYAASFDGGWRGNDYQARLAGSFGAYPWQLQLDGPLDTDYACTTRLHAQAPPGPSFTVTWGGRGGTASGTEADLIPVVFSLARSLFGRRKETAAGDLGRQGPDTAGVHADLRVNDEAGVMVPELLDACRAWPAPTQQRSNLHRDGVVIRYSGMTASLDVTTENLWGDAVVRHQLELARRIIERLSGIAPA
jgi:hypothetical protein